MPDGESNRRGDTCPTEGAMCPTEGWNVDGHPSGAQVPDGSRWVARRRFPGVPAIYKEESAIFLALSSRRSVTPAQIAGARGAGVRVEEFRKEFPPTFRFKVEFKCFALF